MKKIGILFLILFIFNPVFSQTNQIQVIAWNGVPSGFTNPNTYQQLVNAGITINHVGFHSLNDAVKALDLAEKNGIKLLLNCPEMFDAPEETARRMMNHPGLAGYFLADEPGVKEFETLKRIHRQISSVDNKHLFYINLFPIDASTELLGTNSYKSYIEQFFKNFNLKIYSFDFYPIYNGVVKPNWYSNLEIFSEYTKNKGAHFWAFAKTTSYSDQNEKITIEDLRLQAFTNLAYGAQGIQYFTYWMPEKGYFNGPINSKGIKQSGYDNVSIISDEIKSVSPVFYNSRVEKVYHTEQTEGTTLFKNNFLELKLNYGKNLLISRISNGNNRYIVFVNKDLANVNNVSISSKIDFNIVNKNRSTIPFKKNVSKTFSIGKGDLLILKY
ncbi:hypothetical protein EG347_09100 [Chryseobacterium sp. G0186]|uniref:hypothetical protein n=1 Tax=Chryseobacterium sp. G0186 TaxID=2487064 RepID=UPI000F517212|nr:hypothetical protein [Chryseobacterium sp. G0186]AZA77663.1 hypothetical protein EG347_09100 [Chryseobacterium sp. G0186]